MKREVFEIEWNKNLTFTKDDIYLIWIVRNILNFNFFEEPLTDKVWIFILNKEELKSYTRTALHNFIIENYWINNYAKWSWCYETLEINDEYSILFYWYRKDHVRQNKLKIQQTMLMTLKEIFTRERFSQYKQNILDIFWYHWCYLALKIATVLLYNISYQTLFWKYTLEKNFCTSRLDSDITIDFEILEHQLKAWKEDFDRKMNLFLKVYAWNFWWKTIILFRDIYTPNTFLMNKAYQHYINKRKIPVEWYKFSFYWMKYLYLVNHFFKEFITKYVNNELLLIMPEEKYKDHLDSINYWYLNSKHDNFLIKFYENDHKDFSFLFDIYEYLPYCDMNIEKKIKNKKK